MNSVPSLVIFSLQYLVIMLDVTEPLKTIRETCLERPFIVKIATFFFTCY